MPHCSALHNIAMCHITLDPSLTKKMSQTTLQDLLGVIHDATPGELAAGSLSGLTQDTNNGNEEAECQATNSGLELSSDKEDKDNNSKSDNEEEVQ